MTLLDVERHGDRWAVVPHVIERDTRDRDKPGEPIRLFDNAAPAWHMACWYRFEQDGTLPNIDAGNWFKTTSGPAGWTSDPRFAETVPADQVDTDTRKRIDRAVVKFIRARIGAMDDMEVFMPDDQQPEHVEPTEDTEPWEYPEPEGRNPRQQHADDDGPEVFDTEDDTDTTPYAGDDPETVPESDSPEPVAPEGATTPEDDSEALRTALSDSDRQAFDNYTHLAETAPSESGREFWQQQADNVLSGE